jgi:hypothetical protein
VAFKAPSGWHYDAGLALKELKLAAGIKWLSAALLKHGFVIIKINGARGTGKEDLYNALGCGSVLRRISGEQIFQPKIPKRVCRLHHSISHVFLPLGYAM